MVSETFRFNFGKFDKTFTKETTNSIVNPMAVLKGSVFWTLGLYSCPNSSKLHDGCLSNFQICPSGCLLHSGCLLFLAKSDLLVGNSIRSVIRYLRVHWRMARPNLERQLLPLKGNIWHNVAASLL